jgi:hypothetical protein
MKPDKIIVKPADGKKVKDPATMQFIPDEGKTVDNISYWHRRAKDGDVVISLPKKTAKPVSDKEAKPAKTKEK